MKKITVESCGECPEYWRCQPAINDGGNSVREGFIYPDCPLEDDEPSIPVSKIRERINELNKESWKYPELGTIAPKYYWQIRALEYVIWKMEDEK